MLESRLEGSAAQSAGRYIGVVPCFKHREHKSATSSGGTEVITQRYSLYDDSFLFPSCKTMKTSTPESIKFRGDEAVLNINRFNWNFIGFVFATNLTLRRGVNPFFESRQIATSVVQRNNEIGM